MTLPLLAVSIRTLGGRDAQKIWDDHRNCRKPLQAKALISTMAYENHWLPDFNVEEWFEGETYETLAMCRTPGCQGDFSRHD